MVHGGPPRMISSSAAPVDRHSSRPTTERYYRPAPSKSLSRTSPQRQRTTSPTKSRQTTSFSSPGQRRAAVSAARGSPGDTRGHSTSRERAAQHNRDPPPQEQHGDAGESLCDYDTSATVLYELLESSCWEKARSRCRSHPTEARTWILRKDKSLRVRWKLLPLHAAIIFQSPNFVVSSLLERYPGAASRKDDQGMLPLHLAFRHKHEDEDLLELLLIQNPKAVMIKDRRDRVPLEHGRECKYSAKLMRLYADATVAGSRALSIGRGDETLASKSVSASQLARVEAENDARVSVVREEYEGEIRAMKTVNDDRMKTLRDHHAGALMHLQNEAEDEKQALVDVHTEEMNGLRHLLSGLANKEKKSIDEMEEEVIQLRAEMDDAELETARVSEQYSRLLGYTNELREVMEAIGENQSSMEDMAVKQQVELDAASQMRKQLVQTLLRQEDDEGENDRLRGTKLVEIAKSTRHAIEQALETNVLREPQLESHRGSRRESRGCRERVELDEVREHRETQEHQERRPHREFVSRVEVERENTEVVLEEDDRFTEHVREEFYRVDEEKETRLDYLKTQAAKESTDQLYSDEDILEDEISAITECGTL